MERIKLHDKVFEVSIPSEKIQEAVRKVAEQISRDYNGDDCPIFLSVLNGSFMFTADLLKNIEFNSEISFTKLFIIRRNLNNGQGARVDRYHQEFKR